VRQTLSGGKSRRRKSSLSTCPRCGHEFVTANIWHSCTNIDLDEAFARSRPEIREAFERYVDLIRRCGVVTVIAQKTRIVIMGRVRFAGAIVRRDKLIANFALRRALDDPRFDIQAYNDRWIAHRFEVCSAAELEIPGLPDLLCESYRELGMQEAPFRQARKNRVANESAASIDTEETP
jgi:hypothetical protein